MSHFKLEYTVRDWLRSLNDHPIDDYKTILKLTDAITIFCEETLPAARRHCLKVEDHETLMESLSSDKISHEREIVWLLQEHEYDLARTLIEQELKWIETYKLVGPLLENLYLEVVRLQQQLQQLLLAAGASKEWVSIICSDYKIDKSLRRRRPYCDARRFIDSKIQFMKDPNPAILETVDALILTWNLWWTEYQGVVSTSRDTKRQEFLLRIQQLSTDTPIAQFIEALLQS